MVKKFLSYVEITTKITSIFSFLYTIVFLYYKNQLIDWKLTFIFFLSMFLFDLAVTAINNYIDTKTNHQTLQFKRNTALMIIIVLVGISAAIGLYLAYLTDFVVLFLGGLCFLCGILYTYGPIPISRQPFGEMLSGIFYGFLIPFILLYINAAKGTYLSLSLSVENIAINLKVIPLAAVILFSIVPFCATANIMLANNICDLKKDIAVKRYTLPYYLGNKSLYLFAGIYYLAYIAIMAMVIFKIISPICLISLLTIFMVQKNINQFLIKQDKSSTFVLSVKNYIIIMGSITLMIFISGFLL